MLKGERIKLLRKQKGLTQDDFAKMLNTKRQTVSKYEKSIVTNIPSDRIEAMAQILDTTPEYILGWDLHHEKPAENGGLPESVKRLLAYMETVPEGKADLILQVARLIAESDK